MIRLRLPPLRDRVEDIAPLSAHFLRTGARELGVEEKVLTPEALEVVKRFPFPGNVRQLENLCRWLLVMAPSKEIRVEDLPLEIRSASEAPEARVAAAQPQAPSESAEEGQKTWTGLLAEDARKRLQEGESGVWQTLSDEFERALIRSAMEVTRGRRIEAAERLGVGRNTLTRKIQELGLADELAAHLPPLRRTGEDLPGGKEK